jgi:hypothetical protein
VLGEVLDVEELERDARPPKLLVHPRQVRFGPASLDVTRARAIELPLDRGLGQRLDRRPRQCVRTGPSQDGRDGARTDADTPGDLAVAALGDPLESQNLS